MSGSGLDAVSEGVAGVDEQFALGHDPGFAADGGDDLAVLDGYLAFEEAADDAFLAPDAAFGQGTIGIEAGELGAGAGAAGGAVVGFAGAEHETLAIGARGGGKKLDVVDFRPVRAAQAVEGIGFAQTPGEIGELFEVLQAELQTVVVAEEEPVAAPGDITVNGAAIDLDGDMREVAVGGDVAHGDFVWIGVGVFGWVQGGFDDADRGFDAVGAGGDAAFVGERGDQADGAVPAHAQVAYIIKEDHTELAGGVGGRDEQGTDHDIRAARFIEYTGAEGVVPGAQGVQLFGNGAGA